MKTIVVVVLSVLLGAAFAPTLGPMAREQLTKGANWVLDHAKVEDRKTTVGEKGENGKVKKDSTDVLTDAINQVANNVVEDIKKEVNKGENKREVAKK